MDDVGFELYCQMLNQAVREIKGEPVKRLEVKIEVPVSAYIPNDYIDEEGLRTEAYKKLSLAAELDEVDEAIGELEDRYGALPEPVCNLREVLRLRVLARGQGGQQHNLGPTAADDAAGCA